MFAQKGVYNKNDGKYETNYVLIYTELLLLGCVTIATRTETCHKTVQIMIGADITNTVVTTVLILCRWVFNYHKEKIFGGYQQTLDSS